MTFLADLRQLVGQRTVDNDHADRVFGFDRKFTRRRFFNIRCGFDFAVVGNLETGVRLLDALLEFRRLHDRFPGDHGIAHAVQLVQRPLQQGTDPRCRFDPAVVERSDQRLEFMAQIAHSPDAGHAGTAFQGVQMTFEFMHVLLRSRIPDPLDERFVGGFEQLRGFLGENRRDLCVVLGFLRRFFRLRCHLRLRFLRRFRCNSRFFLDLHLRLLHRIGQVRDVVDQRRVVGTIALGLIDVRDNRLDRPGRRLQSAETRSFETDFVFVNPSHEAIKCAGNGNAAFDVCHIGAAVQGMTRAIQLVGDGKRCTVPFAGRQVIGDDLDMPGRLLGEDIEQDRVHFECRRLVRRGIWRRPVDGQHRGVRVAFGKRVGPGNQQRDISDRFRPDLELLDELRHRCRCVANEARHRRRTHKGLVDELVEQVLDAPAILAYAFRADHAAAAFERVVGAPNRDQRLHVVRRFDPGGKVPIDRRDFFFRFLDEQLEQVRVEMLRIRCYNRQRNNFRSSHALGFGCFRRLVCEYLRLEFGHVRLPDLLRHRNRLGFRLLLQPIFNITQDGEAGFGIVEHVPGLAAAGLNRLHVVLDADDRVRKPVSLSLGQLGRTTALQRQRHDLPDSIHDFHGASLAEHQQACLDASYERRHAVETLRRRLRSQALADCLLDAREVDDALAHDGLGDLLVFGIVRQPGCLLGFGRFRRYDEPFQLLVEPVFHAQ